MKKQKNIRTTLCASIVILAGMTISTTAFAHCDGMDGPVITEAKSALQAHDVTPLLKWVPENREDTVRKAFDEAISKQAEQSKQQVNQSVKQGRGYVNDYVHYIHFVEEVNGMAAGGSPEMEHQH